MIAIVVMLIALMSTSMAVVREKEIGTIEQMMVTPITPAEFILGKTLPFALIGFADMLLVAVVGVFWFGVPIQGSLLLLFFATALYLMTTLGIGPLLSTVSQTQQQAMMSAFSFTFPPYCSPASCSRSPTCPRRSQWLTYLNPLRYYLIVVRGIFLKGVSPEILWPEMLALVLLGVALLWLSASRFKKTLA